MRDSLKSITDELNVSRETMDGLTHYANELTKWNSKINLVSPNTIETLWDRHIADSLQLARYVKNVSIWADFGSGAGLPALIAGYVTQKRWGQLILVESDKRKSAFLRKIARELGVAVVVQDERIERINPLNADLITARALADLPQLLGYSIHHLHKNGYCLFPKGRSWHDEVETARIKWKFALEIYPSLTDKEAKILEINSLEVQE